MILAALWLVGTLIAVPSAGQFDNLTFAAGRLTGWEGHGFAIGPAGGSGPTLHFGVASGDRVAQGRKALLYRTIVVPYGVSAITTRAAAIRSHGAKPGPRLDILLEGAERRILPKLRRTAEGWQPVNQVQPGTPSSTTEYMWRLDGLAGHSVRILLIDDDDRPGCYLACSGFRFATHGELAAQEFRQEVRQLTQKKALSPVTRADSPHFIAVGTAEDSFVERRLNLCESLYTTFFDHFRSHGLPARPPKDRLFVAVFETEEEMEAAVGHPLSSAITGIYMRTTNRLLVYDAASNRTLREKREQTKAAVMRLQTNEYERNRVIAEFDKRARAWRDETNASTILHETAHQLSFNGGLLNREGDVPLWLAEGLACYCEGPGADWRGPGGPNPERTKILDAQIRANAAFLPLKTLVENDDWFTRNPTNERILLGYSQSWALFRMLMEERSPLLQRYLSTVYERRTSNQRLADFVDSFGDLGKLEARYQVYLREVAAKGVKGT